MIQSLTTFKEDHPRVWYLPSGFAKEIKQGVNAETIPNDYEGRWMRKTNSLEHCNVLSELFRSMRNIINFMHTSLHPRNWEAYVYPAGLPRNVTSTNSDAWCLSWLSHDGGFPRFIFENNVITSMARMRVALQLVQWEHNEVGGLIDRNVEKLWNRINHPA
ncbi:hypothetical protein PIB30_006092 [Stylosanthes scabra]|uniref:Uncharacterized protein n=1 Tax=Stylosanthes scabra TaxID=79078 RepID=A0ABU6V2H3_9FABA|nr:hypothetical protein [Stylosanthes scabra]